MVTIVAIRRDQFIQLTWSFQYQSRPLEFRTADLAFVGKPIRQAGPFTGVFMITLEQLEEMFANMREHTDWDVEGELLWGYFFTDTDHDKLEKAAVALDEMGYDVVEVFESEDDEDPSITDFVLHVERIEAHTPQSLLERNKELEAFAQKQGLQSFDGVDVGTPFDDDDEMDDEGEDDEEP